MGLTLADVDRWQPDAVQAAGDDLLKRGTSVEALKDSLRKLPFIGRWQGQAGPAAEESIDKVARYLMVHNDALQAAGKAMQKSAADIWLVKKALTAAEDEADAGHFTIDKATGNVTPKNKDCDPQTQADIKNKVQQVLALADTADAELAHATKLVTGAAAPGDPSGITTPTGAQTGEAVDYAQRSRDKDLATVAANANSPEGQAAAARLRDYNTLTNPAAGADAKKFAAERLGDFRSAQFVGPQERDRLFGQTPAERAQTRLKMQQLGESPELKGRFTPDQVTQMVDNSEAKAQTMLPQTLVRKLEGMGMSPEGAAAVVENVEHGKGIPEELVHANQGTGALGEGLKNFGESQPTGRHSMEAYESRNFTAGDAEVVGKLGKYMGRAGSVGEVLLGVYEWQHGAPLGEVAAKTGASIWGGMLAGGRMGALGGELIGPEGALVLGGIGALGGGIAAGSGAEWLYKWMDE